MKLFSNKFLTLPKQNELEICIFGMRYGESIVLHIPKIGWGIIDSCIEKIKSTSTVLPLIYLSELFNSRFPKLAFVILTHPHEDHYKGLDQILLDYPGGIERVCWYNGSSIRELKTYITRQKIGSRNVFPGFVKVFNALTEAVEKGAQPRMLSELTTVFELKDVVIEGYGDTDIHMIALSPSAESIKKYTEMLFQAIPQPGKPILPMRDEAHNLISVALLLKLGELQIVFGSDLENGSEDSTGWSCLINNKDCPDLWASFVKVAHHGSENGFYPLAWEKHCGNTKPIGVVTPFVKGNINIPKEKDVENLKEVSRKLGITGALNFSTKLTDFYSRDVAMEIMQRTRSLKVIKSFDKIGFIRVRFLLNGKVTECISEPPAKWL